VENINMVAKVYIDTSVVGGYLDDEFSSDTQALFRRLENFEYIELTKEAVDLADKYIDEKVAGKTSAGDCRHIALATINRADVLVSWNFNT
jgi:hypothetical protein